MRITLVSTAGFAAAFSFATLLAQPADASVRLRLKNESRAEWGGAYHPTTGWEGDRVAWDAPPPPGVQPPTYQPPVYNGGGGSGGVIINHPGYPTVPVSELLSVNRVGTVATRAKAGPWDPARAQKLDNFATPDPGSHSKDHRFFSEVVDGGGAVLSNATGIGSYSSNITGDTFAVSGEFSASTLVRPGAAANAHAVASAQSVAFFRVTERTTFDLAISMGISDNVRLGFSVMRWRDRTNVLAFGRNYLGVGDDEYVFREYGGTIEPGVYRLAVTALTRSRLNGKGEPIFEGGEATFSTRMLFHHKPDPNGRNQWLDPGSLVLFDPGLADVLTLDSPLDLARFSGFAVPEPGAATLLLTPLALLARRRGR